MTLPIRYSPSGPIVANASGGPFNPGPGMIMRTLEHYANVDISNPTDIDTTVGGVTLGQVGPMVGVDSALQYRVEAHVPVFNPSTAIDQTLTLELQLSTNAGATWTTIADEFTDIHAGGAAGAVGQKVQAKVHYAIDSFTTTLAVTGDDVLIRLQAFGSSSVDPLVLEADEYVWMQFQETF